MQQLSYTLENAEGKTYLREYVYYVGSFHYNWHKEIELICVLNGQIEVCAGGNVYNLEADDVLLINANVGHATLSRVPDSAIMLVRISPSFLKKACPDFEHTEIRLCSKAENRQEKRYAELRRCMALMLLSQLSDQPLRAFAFDSALYTLAWTLLREFPPRRQNSTLYSDKDDEQHVYEIIQFLEEHYQEKISLQEIAKHWNYSSSYTSQLFKEYVGINFYDYLTRIRLRQATRMLSETDMRVLDIASENGFQDLKSFNTKFREIYNRTPSDYRKSLAEEHARYDASFKKVFINSDDAFIMERIRFYAEQKGSILQTAIEEEAAPAKPSGIDREKARMIACQLKKIAESLEAES